MNHIFQMYAAACRAERLLQSRYTSSAFWKAGLKLFQQAEAMLTEPKEKRNMQGFVQKARVYLGEQTERETLPPHMRAGTSNGFVLFFILAQSLLF